MISSNSAQEKTVAEQDADHDVVEYLRHHADFFERHHELLAELRIPHQAKGAVSLIERQITALRDQNRQLRRQLHDLVDIAHENDALHERMHRLIVDVLHVSSVEEMREVLTRSLHDDFKADAVSLHLLDDVSDEEREEFHALLAMGKPACGEIKPSRAEWLFGEMAESIASAALVPLADDALLAVGGHDATRYTLQTSTDYLCRLAEVLSVVLARLRKQ